MKFELKEKKLSISMVVIVILCLIVTGIIIITIMKQADADETRPWFIQQSLDTHEAVKLEDAYIVSNKDGVLELVHNKETYFVEGKLSKDFSGVADILAEEGKITRIYVKPDLTEGTLMRYTDAELELETAQTVETGNVPDAVRLADEAGVLKRKQTVPVYQVVSGKVKEIAWTSLTVGTSVVKAVMEKGQVSALIIEEEIVPTDINVLIRNGDSIFYQSIYVRKVSENTFVNANDMLSGTESCITLTDNKGLLLCDAQNNPLGEVYEGELRIYKTAEGLVLVNKLPVETYLKYVIPSEMPKSFSKEALKAQAVCARTFAYSQMKNGTYAQYGANLDNTTDYQVYHAFGRYDETDVAVDETKGEVILYNDKMIHCYYFSSSAGITNDFSVWGDASAEYISMKGLEAAGKLDLTNKADFSEYINSAYETNDSQSPFYRWNVTLDIGKVKESSLGALKSIEVKKRNPAGYVTELLMTYDKKEVILTVENDIRKALGLYLLETVLNDGTKRPNISMIPSACFEVTEMADGKILLKGGGYGHGIGLSQYGAGKMAEEGKTYQEIIKYYYSNVTIRTL